MSNIKSYNSSQIKEEMDCLEKLQNELNKGLSGSQPVMREPIEEFARKVGAQVPWKLNYMWPDSLIATLSNIRIVLEAKMMFNACESAKWSCWFAAAAALLSLVATSVALMTFLLN